MGLGDQGCTERHADTTWSRNAPEPRHHLVHPIDVSRDDRHAGIHREDRAALAESSDRAGDCQATFREDDHGPLLAKEVFEVFEVRPRAATAWDWKSVDRHLRQS